MNRFSMRRLKKLPELRKSHITRSSLTNKSFLFSTPQHPEKARPNPNRTRSYSPSKPKKLPSHIPLVPLEFQACPFGLDQLQMGHLLGQSKLGRVMLAKVGYKEYAVKVISREGAKYAISEIQALQKLSHELIVKYYGCLMDSKNYYLVLENLAAGDLFSVMQQTRLNKKTVKQLAAEIAVALDVVHRAGLVYRDLKPENVMLNFEGHIKLIDFGTAKCLRPGEWTYTVCGSPQYLAPEVIMSQGHNSAADWWTLGILIYEMLTG
mmetsp:Transcript_2509/g.5761  ORF Transcript_2509/g.5761 Transcript_2509/m.5761 type:complete len:265 (-) Transcript_2509:349-1143(-)